VTPSKSSPFVTAVRSLLSNLPRQADIKPLADIAFKAYGFSTSVTITGNQVQATTTSLVGFYSATAICVRDLIAFANTSFRSEAGEVYAGAQAQSKIDIVKILNMQIAIRNTTTILFTDEATFTRNSITNTRTTQLGAG
jgi:hypothetical protein